MKPHEESSPGVLVLAGLLLPFYLNDAANILVENPSTWLAWDYAVRLAVLAAVWVVFRKSQRRFPIEHARSVSFLGRGNTRAGIALGWMIGATATGLFIVAGPGRSLLHLWPATQVGAVPSVVDTVLRAVDLTFGLMLVAVSEEVVFRGIVLPVFAAAWKSNAVALLVSSILFGAAHWSMGVGAILQTTLAGLVLGICALRCRSVYPAIAAHYVIDLVAFM